jgi:NADH-quinone oxidoreductase subunit J
MLQTWLFYLISAAVVASAVGVVASRSALHSVLCLVSAMCFLSALFVLLKAYFVAVVMVLVYAGAILVLFLFVVMLVDFRKLTLGWTGWTLSPAFALGLGALLFVQILAVIRKTSTPTGQTAGALVAGVQTQGNAEAIGRLLFSRYMLPFELTSFLLLAAVVSVVVLAKKEVK